MRTIRRHSDWGVSDSTLKNDNNLEFAPRVGFAYDVLGNGKLAIRGGYGIYHQRIAGGGPLQTLANPPYELGVFNLQFSNHDILSNPFPGWHIIHEHISAMS